MTEIPQLSIPELMEAVESRFPRTGKWLIQAAILVTLVWLILAGLTSIYDLLIARFVVAGPIQVRPEVGAGEVINLVVAVVIVYAVLMVRTDYKRFERLWQEIRSNQESFRSLEAESLERANKAILDRLRECHQVLTKAETLAQQATQL